VSTERTVNYRATEFITSIKYSVKNYIIGYLHGRLVRELAIQNTTPSPGLSSHLEDSAISRISPRVGLLLFKPKNTDIQ